MANKRILCYDISLLPKYSTLRSVVDDYKKENVVRYDSFNTDKKPFIVNLEDETDTFDDIMFEDVNKKENYG